MSKKLGSEGNHLEVCPNNRMVTNTLFLLIRKHIKVLTTIKTFFEGLHQIVTDIHAFTKTIEN